MRPPHYFDKSAIEKIQTGPQIDDGSHHCRLLDLLFTAPLVPNFAGKLIRSLSVVFPEINAVTEPVVVILALPQ